MTELANTMSREMVFLDTLASEARLLTENIAMNMLQLGRVLTEAKALTKHGEWGTWVKKNCDISERYAQQFMAAWERFGARDGVERLGKSKILRLLALPEGKEDEFLESHDVDSMTAREVEAAVKRTRQEMEREIEAERRKRIELENRPIPDEVFDQIRRKDEIIAGMRAEVDRLAGLGQDSVTENNDLRRENARLQAELREQNELCEEQQEDVRRAQEELLDLKSQMAKGDAERKVTGDMSVSVFAGAVRTFIGACARVPHMRRVFTAMSDSEWNEWDELLKTVESWAKDSRKALNAVNAEGGVSA